MFRRPISLVFLIYIIIGLVIAWEKHYITVNLLKGVLSALLAIFLWWLPLLGVSLHIHCIRPSAAAGYRSGAVTG